MSGKINFIGQPNNPYAFLAHCAEQPGIEKIVCVIYWDDGNAVPAISNADAKEVCFAAAMLTDYALKASDSGTE